MNEVAPYGTFAPTGLARWIIERTRGFSEGWSSRRVALIMRRFALQALGGAPVDAAALGARMRLMPYDNICDRRLLFTPQFFDAIERRILEERLTPSFVFIDVGANIGAYSLFVAARAGPGARIFAVEPQPRIFDRLSANIRFNPFGTVKAVACAVVDKAGELTMFLDARNAGESSVKIVGSGEAATIRVPATTLLDLARDEGLERIDAVKLDVEGAEDLILSAFLRDAPESLFPSLLIIERSDGWQSNVPDLLEANGYRLVTRTRLNMVYERP